MATTCKHDREFAQAVASPSLLDDSIDWINSNLAPEWVFSQEHLEQWADENGYMKGDD